MFVHNICGCSSIDIHAVDVVSSRMYLDGKWLLYCVVRSQFWEGDLVAGGEPLANFLLDFALPRLYHVDRVCLVFGCLLFLSGPVLILPFFDIFYQMVHPALFD